MTCLSRIFGNQQTVVLLLPIVFMLHDFEELIWMRPWLGRQDAAFRARIPRRFQASIRQMLDLSPTRFAAIIGFEFVMLTAAALWALCGLTASMVCWFGALSVFTLHLVMHVGQAVFMRRLVPPVLSSILALPYCGFAYFYLARIGIFSTRLVPWLAVSFVLWSAGTVFGFRMIGGIGRHQ